MQILVFELYVFFLFRFEESQIDEKTLEVQGKDEVVAEKEKLLKEKEDKISSLQTEVSSLQVWILYGFSFIYLFGTCRKLFSCLAYT